MSKVIREHVVAFRLSPEEMAEFSRKYESDKLGIVGVKSIGMMARKLAIDYARDKIRWPNKKDKGMAPEVRKVSSIADAA